MLGLEKLFYFGFIPGGVASGGLIIILSLILFLKDKG